MSLLKGCGTEWFTNNTYNPGANTLPDEFYDLTAYGYDDVEEIKATKHPWTSPGSAPGEGNGCGANGGNPHGCQCHACGTENGCYGEDDRPYGACCTKVLFSKNIIV